jgi:hypothetical protein
LNTKLHSTYRENILYGIISGSGRHDVPGSGHIAREVLLGMEFEEMSGLNIKMKKRRTVVQTLTVNIID